MNEAKCVAKLHDELPNGLVDRVIRRTAGLAEVFPLEAHSANDYFDGLLTGIGRVRIGITFFRYRTGCWALF